MLTVYANKGQVNNLCFELINIEQRIYTNNFFQTVESNFILTCKTTPKSYVAPFI